MNPSPILKPINTFLIVAICIYGFTSCGQVSAPPPEKKVVKKKVVVKKDSVVKQNSNGNLYNNISAVLAGLDENGNTLNTLYDSAAWKDNREFMTNSWKKLENTRLSKMEKWSRVELKEAQDSCKTVFYPFSGPDFVTANSFFPTANKIVMLGLEPIGSLPDIGKLNNTDATDYCNDFKNSLNDLFEKSYFITQYMLRDFQKQKVNGLLPVLCFFIKKTNHQITNITYLIKHNNDSISEQPYTTNQKPFGVKVECMKDSLKKTVYYFRYDVSNKQFNDSTVFYKFINQHTQKSVTYIKSASYLLHANFMSNMKKLILKNCKFILEDDTGIPYNDIEKTKQWSIKLYGKYTQPVKNFPYLKMQTGIVKAFETDSANIPDVPFHLGYHWMTKKDLLIYAKKIK